jgi:hypothetical protein
MATSPVTNTAPSTTNSAASIFVFSSITFGLIIGSTYCMLDPEHDKLTLIMTYHSQFF